MDRSFESKIARIEELIHEIETTADPNLKAVAVDLVDSLISLHGAGLSRTLELVAEKQNGQSIIDELGTDDLVSNLLILHGLHPLRLQDRVQQALAKVGPYLASHGGSVELLEITDEAVVRLRLQGSCKTCPSSTMTLKLAIEEAIHEAAPDVTAVEAEGLVPAPASSFVQISKPNENGKKTNPERGNGWETVPDLHLLAPSSVKALEVGGRSVLFCRLGEDLYAYGNSCAGCGESLHTALLEMNQLSCPACGQHYDVVAAGRGLDQSNLHLEPFPLLVEKGQAKVSLPPLDVRLAPAN